MENKKSGIRLRHLEQQQDQANKRDLSPNNPNRRKIFEYNNRKANEKVQVEQKPLKKARFEQNSNEYQELIESLKKKTMEVQLRDEAIRSLNKQIEELKNQLQLKDKEISKLTQQIAFLQNGLVNQPPPKKEKAQPFPRSEFASYSYLDENKSNNRSYEAANDRNYYQEKRVPEEISLGNLNFRNQFEEKVEEGQILSPFMALNDNNHTFSSQITTKQKYEPYSRKQSHTSRISEKLNQNDYQHSSTQYSGFYKKKSNQQFDFNQQDPFPKKTMLQSVNKQLQKFNIFPEPQKNKEIFARSKLQIEDSREFKFEEYDEKGFSSFTPSNL